MSTEDKIIGILEKQSDVLTKLQVDMAKVTVDLSHHIQGVMQNRQSLELMRQELKNQREATDRRMDLVEAQNIERLAVEKGQARVFKWASVLLGIVATALGIIFTLGRL